MMMRNSNHTKVRQRGAVLVEMVLVTPILLFLMLATAEVTRLFIDHNTLTKAVRNGARYVSANALSGTTGVVSISGALRTETQNLVVYGNTAGAGTPVLTGLSPADISVLNSGADNVEVGAAYSTTGIFGATLRSWFGPDINLAQNLEASVTMRAL